VSSLEVNAACNGLIAAAGTALAGAVCTVTNVAATTATRAITTNCNNVATSTPTTGSYAIVLPASLNPTDAFNTFVALAKQNLCARDFSPATFTAGVVAPSTSNSPSATRAAFAQTTGGAGVVYSDSLDEKKKIAVGLGVGLGVGIPLLLALLLIAFCCCLKNGASAATYQAPVSYAQTDYTRNEVDYGSSSSASQDGTYYSNSGTEESYGDDPLSDASSYGY